MISSEYENQCGRETGSLWFEQADIQLSHIHEVYCIHIPRAQGKLKILRFCPFCGLAHASEKLIMLFHSQGSQCSSWKGLKPVNGIIPLVHPFLLPPIFMYSSPLFSLLPSFIHCQSLCGAWLGIRLFVTPKEGQPAGGLPHLCCSCALHPLHL